MGCKEAGQGEAGYRADYRGGPLRLNCLWPRREEPGCVSPAALLSLDEGSFQDFKAHFCSSWSVRRLCACRSGRLGYLFTINSLQPMSVEKK